MPPHSPTYAPLPPSFPVPSFPGAQSPAYFEPVIPAHYSPPIEPEFPDPYLARRYQTPLPLPPGAPRPSRHIQDKRPVPAIPPLAAAASSSTQRGGRVAETDDERAARELQLWEDENARARREQEERDEELARTLDQELNMGGGGGAQDEPGRSSHSQFSSLSTGVVRKASVGEW